MKELIKVTTNNEGKQLVSARELYKGLKVQKDFSDWIKNQLENVDAVEGKDFSTLKGKTSEIGGRPSIEYALTIEIAKEICMVVGIAPRTNEETRKLSKEYRKYLIKVEEEYRELKENPYKNLSKELQAIFIHDEKIQKIEEDIKHLQDDVPLYTSECEVLQNKLRANIVKLLGGKSAPAYRNASLRKKAYVDIQNQIKREFNVYSYKSISRKYYQKALETIDNYIFPTVLNNEATKLNNQILMDIINKRY